MKKRKVTFEELVNKNKEELLNNKQLLEEIEKRLELRHSRTKQKGTGLRQAQG